MSDKEKERLRYLKGIHSTRKQIKDRQDHLTALKMMYIMYFCPFKKGDKISVTNGKFNEVGFVYATFMDEKTGEFYYQIKKVLKDGTQSQIDLWHPMLDTKYEKVVEEEVNV